MKISTKGRYGLRILLDLALHENSSPRMIRDIAESQNISEKYISRLIIELRKAGMVQSVRGAKGGYRLARIPKYLTVLDVVEVMEGPIAIVDCIDSPGMCLRQDLCAAREIWMRLNREIRESLGKISLQDLVDSSRRNSSDFIDYCI